MLLGASRLGKAAALGTAGAAVQLEASQQHLSMRVTAEQ
jgi:hypothetical protein